jgi:hypothetical protein
MAETTDESRTSSTADAPDPLAKLYHMSTTAGVGTQEYVAINVFAVISVVLGLASGLLLMGWDNPTLFYVLLVIPIAGLIFAILAIAQIRNSNGTQAGIGWAIGGVLLSLIFAATVTAHHIQSNIEAEREQAAIKALVDRFGQALIAGDYAAARTMFVPQFQEQWPPELFRTQLERVLVSENLGKLQGARASDRIAIDDYAGGKRGVGQMIFQFEKVPNAPIGAQFEKSAADWQILFCDLFPPQGPGGPGRQ